VPSAAADNFVQTNLVSDMPGLAANTDPQLINPWGLTASSQSPFWVSDNQVGVSTLYNGQGDKLGLVVNIPSAPGSPFAHATPTGTVFNIDGGATGGFKVSGLDQKGNPITASAVFLFATLDGSLSGWNPGVDPTGKFDGPGGISDNAAIAVPNPGAIYTGLAIDTSATAGNTLLYAADWGKGTVDVFNAGFQQIDQGAFQDKAIPTGFRPFNVQAVNGDIYVTYAQFDPTTGADTGTGGFVAKFTHDGVLEQTLTGHGHFNSPWGIAQAPKGFGDLGGDLLVGNFGDGHINAFDKHGRFVTTLDDVTGQPITIGNLWALRFGNGGAAGSPNTLFFTAGVTDAPKTMIFGATDGLLGSIQAEPVVHGNRPVLPELPNAVQQSFSTVGANGDVNPYGVAFVPQNFKGGGQLAPGDILVSNFNDSGNVQATGSTIVLIKPDGEHSTFFQGQQGLGLTTALGVLPQGFVLVGSAPATTQSDGTPTVADGSLLILDSNGNQVGQLSDSALLRGPWDLTINNTGPNSAEVFVSNVLSGTVTRINLSIPTGGLPQVISETQIASGYAHRTDMNALVVGPTGLVFDARRDVLYVVSTADNAIFAIKDASTSTGGTGKGKLVTNDPNHLHGPLGMTQAPNGDLIVANGDAVNQDPNHLNELDEFTPQGKFVGQFQLDTGMAGAAFGVALQAVGRQVRFAAVDDNTNMVNVFTFDPPDSGATMAMSATMSPANMGSMGMTMDGMPSSRMASMDMALMADGPSSTSPAAMDQLFMDFEVALQEFLTGEAMFLEAFLTDIAQAMMMGASMRSMV
jgi:uncharacterized protein (TIGR03118 family)